MSTLNFSCYGEPNDHPPLLVLHGLFGSAGNWRSIARQLSSQFQVFALDLRNHGGSFWDDTMSYAVLADDVAHFLEQQQLAPANIIGHSMGGKTAMALALNQADCVERLIVVDIAPVEYSHSHSGYIDALLDLDLSSIKSRSEADKALSEAIPEAGIRLFLLQNLVQQDGGFRWRLNLPVLRDAMLTLTSFPALQTRFDGPSLFLYGEQSDYVLPTHHAAIKQHFPQAALQSVTEAGHWLHAEQPALMIETARRFFA